MMRQTSCQALGLEEPLTPLPAAAWCHRVQKCRRLQPVDSRTQLFSYHSGLSLIFKADFIRT